jgi:hypothetical protein
VRNLNHAYRNLLSERVFDEHASAARGNVAPFLRIE